jgi:hypothetical protein
VYGLVVAKGSSCRGEWWSYAEGRKKRDLMALLPDTMGAITVPKTCDVDDENSLSKLEWRKN